MPLALVLFPDIDRVEDLVEASMPWFTLWLFALGFLLVGHVIQHCLHRARSRSPVEKLLRRRFG